MTGAVLVETDAVARLEAALAQALEANERLVGLVERQREEIARLREELAVRDGELERVNAELAVLKRMLFGRSSERARPGTAGGEGGGDQARPAGGGKAAGGDRERGRAGGITRTCRGWRWSGTSPDGGYCCPQCQTPFHRLGDHVTEVLDWLVSVRVTAHCRRRYRRACPCRVPATTTAPGPPKAIGKGLVSNAFIAQWLTERYVAGRSQNSLVTCLARHGADLSPATLTGICAAAGALLAPLEAAVTARSRGAWHLHADETSWRVFAPRESRRPGSASGGCGCSSDRTPPVSSWTLRARARCWPATPGSTRPPANSPTSPAPVRGADGEEGPRRLVISSDFYSVYSSAGRKASGLINLYCWAHVRRHFVRAGDANPDQLSGWTAAWLERIKNLYTAHEQLRPPGLTAPLWAAVGPRTGAGRPGLGRRVGVIDAERTKQMAAPGLQEPAKKALATLDREWDGLAAHRDYPMISLDNNAAERALRRPVVTRKNAYGSRNQDAARLAARVWTITATAEMAGLNVITYLTAYLDACGRTGGKPPTGPDLQRFLPWTATREDLDTWAQPPRPG